MLRALPRLRPVPRIAAGALTIRPPAVRRLATSTDSAVVSRSEAAATEQNLQDDDLRLPLNVQAAYLKPLKIRAEHGIPACDLQLRAYNTRNLDLMADFALRAAYYMGLPASGPVQLPRMIQRWTVPKAPFIFKKSQENFERITYRRLVQIKDANPETVELWLAYIKKHAYYGVGMKANVWENESL